MKIGVLYGGWSSEREVSIRSGKMVAGALRRKGYDVVEIDVDRDIALKLKDKSIDIAFIMLHGKPGEDGTIQGLLEITGIPYTGSGVLSSSLTINKVFTKKIISQSGIRTPDFKYPINPDELPMKPPFLIKPVSEGSSVGISIVRKEEDYRKSCEKANEFGDIFAEKYIDGMEVTVGILGERALPVLELVPKNEFYDYEAKYTEGMTEFIIPARISEEMTERVQNNAIKTHGILGCNDFSRVDFIVSEEKSYVLEVNTIPGMTELSDLPAEASEIGMDYDVLVENILQLALSRM